MSNPLDRLRGVKQQADTADDSRRAYQRFIQSRRDDGWSENDIAEYSNSIKTLMGPDDEAALALFPDGLYKTAEEARRWAVEYWRLSA